MNNKRINLNKQKRWQILLKLIAATAIGLMLGACSVSGYAEENAVSTWPRQIPIKVSDDIANKGNATVTTQLDEFKAIELGGDTQTACSPAQSQDDDFIGVAINVPAEVTFTLKDDDDTAFLDYFPLCGYYQLDMGELAKDATINLYVLNVETEHVNKGAMIEQDPGTEAPLPFDLPPLNPEDLAGQLSAAYFNPNVAEYLSIPALEADYKVVVKVGDTRSNVMDVKVRPAPKDGV